MEMVVLLSREVDGIRYELVVDKLVPDSFGPVSEVSSLEYPARVRITDIAKEADAA
jgi:hypothetical protein